MRRVLRALSAGFLLVLFGLGLGTFVPRPLVAPSLAASAETREILLLSNPIHTDIALPLDDEVRAAFADLIPSGLPIGMPGVDYLVFGWGGRSFYIETPTWGDLKPLPVFRALTLDRSVMHVEAAGPIDRDHPAVRVLTVSAEGRRRMIAAIRDSFQREHGLPLMVEGSAYGAEDAFFEARGRFNALAGCNTWTAAMLREAGLTTGWWTPLPQLLGWSLRRISSSAPSHS
ncbi:TIGR02117 family protein [Rhizobium glycinendophyticum]|uniref:TIGR02117 family protein n=1 Tax=Rhizobium glycinendophyticum TaxID=2589807 RepID=A0A504UBF9_9HYPH|nr:TIGR02117 family protein [Rhizobium glycinendophyticum]TPP11819.1 TIGR02117 family protein [Rhizobium glycinendophyticum]